MSMLRRSRRSSALYQATIRSDGAASRYHICSSVVNTHTFTKYVQWSNPHLWFSPRHPEQATNSGWNTEYERYEPKQIHNVPRGAPRAYSQRCLKSGRCHARKERRNCSDVDVSRCCSLLFLREEHRQRWQKVSGRTRIHEGSTTYIFHRIFAALRLRHALLLQGPGVEFRLYTWSTRDTERDTRTNLFTSIVSEGK